MHPKTAIILLLFLSIFTTSTAQRNTIDSLELRLAKCPLDTNRVLILNQLSALLLDKDLDKALMYGEQGQLLAERLSYKGGLGMVLENLSKVYLCKKDFQKAFESSSQALQIGKELDKKELIAKSLHTIGTIYYVEGEHSLALQHFKESLAKSESNKNLPMTSRNLDAIAKAFMTSRPLDSALHYSIRGVKASEDAQDNRLLALNLLTLGDIYFRTSDYEEAFKHYERCYALANTLGDYALRISLNNRFGNVYNQKKDADAALPFLQENITLASVHNMSAELENAYRYLAEAYFILGDVTSAYQYQAKFIQLHDSLYSLRNREQLALMQAKFEAELKEAQIELLTKDSHLKQREIEDQQVWLYVIVGFLSLISILAFVLLYSYRRIKRINTELYYKNQEIQKHTQQLSNLNVTKDKLFSIISHDLRSPVASLKALMAVVGAGNFSQRDFLEVTNKLKNRLDFVYEDLDNLLQWAQSQLKGLSATPEKFDLRTLADDKIKLFKESARAKSITIINDIPDQTVVFADPNHIGLVIRNLLANAVKFTPDGGVIRLMVENKGYVLEVSVADSGVGIRMKDLNKLFNAETHFTTRGTREEKGIGIGLLLSKEFVERNGGMIWVTSELGKGSTFTFTLQLAPEDKLLPTVKHEERPEPEIVNTT